MGLGWAEAHEEAHIFEHAITPRLEKKVFELAGNPKTCPHGSPIPGTGYRLSPDLVPLATLRSGDEATLTFISEELEEDTELMKYLERTKMMPGGKIIVLDFAPSTGVMVVEREGQSVPLGLAIAAKIRVRMWG